MPIIKTKDFELRQFKKGDEISLQKNINNKKIYDHSLTIPYPYTVNLAKSWILYNMQNDKKKNKTELHFAILKNKEVMGGLSFQDLRNARRNHQAELAYWIAESYWGTGIMQKAIQAFVKFGFQKMKLQKIYVLVFPYDTHSVDTLERAGFTYETTLKNNAKKEGKLIDENVYVKLK